MIKSKFQACYQTINSPHYFSYIHCNVSHDNLVVHQDYLSELLIWLLPVFLSMYCLEQRKVIQVKCLDPQWSLTQ